MAKSKMLATQERIQERISRTKACISRHMELSGVDEDKLAIKMQVTKRTIQNWRDHPEKLDLVILWKLADILKCPVEELCGGALPEENIEAVLAAIIKGVKRIS